ncbi:MAG: undecaprenyldiphospho-muramoylpentapeptide beta-N-acetylglucosaminyltransferase [Candidatus Tokpelaia sp.]|nr:MAG: undecaprenyldiphospho-muramoylpentapeptide beta-N-acetylglucosaminyltransferase [Candidatus Tokpelaia sp.]KAA6206565.1 MAG: undecaprenyldiphospho-muramoylpentapeptide beta-N-acetylglucosaminyltransferase [Candidatus Tokpelaia sp.]
MDSTGINTKKTVFLAAGGTGGHVFPAEALGQALQERGFNVHMLTDSRARHFIITGKGGIKDDKVHVLSAATVAGGNPLRLGGSLWQLGRGFCQSVRLIRRFKPCLVMGFGGYPTVPPLLAARFLRVPILIHEQNSVMGRANRLLARFARAVAAGLPPAGGAAAFSAKTVIVGNPLRPSVLAAAQRPYQAAGDKAPFNLLVFGGSQGASFFSAIMPPALALLPPALRARLVITQQARAADEAELRAAYAKMAIKAEIAVFFRDLPALIAKAQFIIARAGASTVAEIAAIGRPALLVPYPQALDHDQRHNAQSLAASGGAIMVEQAALTAPGLAEIVTKAMQNPQDLARQARLAARAGQRDAVDRLAALVIKHCAAG